MSVDHVVENILKTSPASTESRADVEMLMRNIIWWNIFEQTSALMSSGWVWGCIYQPLRVGACWHWPITAQHSVTWLCVDQSQPVKMIPHLREMSQNITNKPMLDEHDRGYKCLSLIVRIKTVCQARGSGDLEVKIDIHYWHNPSPSNSWQGSWCPI